MNDASEPSTSDPPHPETPRTPERPQRERAPRSQRRAATVSALVLLTLWVFALIVRLTVRDSVDRLAPVYYAAPIGVLAGSAAVIALLFVAVRRPIIATACGLAFVACTLWWHDRMFAHMPPAASGHTLRVLVWNVAHGGWSTGPLISKIREINADVIGLVESQVDDDPDVWRRALPEWHASDRRNGMFIFSRDPIERITSGSLTAGCRYIRAAIRRADTTYDVLVVDVDSNPRRSRREPLRELAAVANSNPDRPLIIMGDFNTPADSIHFDLLRPHLRDCFESAGSGYRASWPVFCPVVAIDHIWVNPRLEPTSCSLGWSIGSDHRPVASELRLLPPD